MPIFSGQRTRNSRRYASRIFQGLQMLADMFRELLENDLAFLGLVLAFGILAMKHGFPVRDQSSELVIQPDHVARGLPKAKPFLRDAFFQVTPLVAELREFRI